MNSQKVFKLFIVGRYLEISLHMSVQEIKRNISSSSGKSGSTNDGGVRGEKKREKNLLSPSFIASFLPFLLWWLQYDLLAAYLLQPIADSLPFWTQPTILSAAPTAPGVTNTN